MLANIITNFNKINNSLIKEIWTIAILVIKIIEVKINSKINKWIKNYKFLLLHRKQTVKEDNPSLNEINNLKINNCMIQLKIDSQDLNQINLLAWIRIKKVNNKITPIIYNKITEGIIWDK